MNKNIVLFLLLALVFSFGLYSYKQTDGDVANMTEDSPGFGHGHTVTMFKDPNCGCCVGHAEALRREGFAVEIREMTDMMSVKQEYNIPLGGESCHTSVIDDYVVEGHVPLEAIEKLLTEKPDLYGIGLPSMPLGTPGMPGIKVAPYEVYQLTSEGSMSPYITI